MKKFIVALMMFAVAIVSAAQTRHEDPDWFVKRNVEPIEPLLKTTWGQGRPYNDLLERKSGICTLVAWCQILHYFRVPQTCKELVKDGVVLPITTFDHNKMLDSYLNVSYTKEQGEEVAKLFYYYHMIDYNGISEYLNLSCKTLDWYETEDFYEKYDYYLERNIPIWSCSINHAFVIDGRDSEGRYHINFGWNGADNGYYALPRCYSESLLYKKNPQGHYYASQTACGFVLIPNWDWSATDINSIKEVNKASRKGYYNLNGQFMGNTVEGLAKGIYIKDGKKVLVK